MKIQRWIKNTWQMLKTKKELIAEFTQIQEELDNKLFDVMKDIEELDQNKVYVLCAPGHTDTEVQALHDTYQKIGNSMKWTIPKLIIINQEVHELKKEELEELLKARKGEKHNV